MYTTNQTSPTSRLVFSNLKCIGAVHWSIGRGDTIYTALRDGVTLYTGTSWNAACAALDGADDPEEG